MRNEELISFCNEHNDLLCYGAGRYANYIIKFLSDRHIYPQSVIITGKPPTSVFMDDISYQSVFEFSVDQSKRYGIILALRLALEQNGSKS